MANVLEVHNVSHIYRIGFWLKPSKVLNEVSLIIPQGAVFGFLGPNGAGKTTLIHLITGLRRPTSGRVTVFGHEAHTSAAKTKIGYLPERPYFHDHLTGEGMLKYYGTLSGMSSADILDRIPKVLSVVGMSHARKLELKRYSKGMLQRIGIAQALIHNPRFLILDEPMSGLDPLGRKEIRELILALAGEGHTIMFSSHVIPDVEAICDQVAVIQKGHLKGCGPIGTFLVQGPLRTEIAFSGENMKSIKNIDSSFLSIREMPDGMRGIVGGQENVDFVLSKLVEYKMRVLWVTPIRPSLETLFKEES